MLVPLLLSLISAAVNALEVSSTSLCVEVCDGPSLTFAQNLTCIDNNYSATSAGTSFKACLQCESTSTAIDGSKNPPQNNDVYWFLFNMKYTLQYCLFQEGNTTTPNIDTCQSSCAALYPVLDTSWFAKPHPALYEYCYQNHTAFKLYAGICAECLHENTGSVILGNFLKAMLSACETRPLASEGQTVKLQRGLFNSATIAGAVTPTSSSPSSASTSPVSLPSPTTSSSGLSTGAAAGIGVACGVVGVVLVGAVVYFIFRRRRRSQTQNNNARERNTPPYSTPNQQQGGGWSQDKKDQLTTPPQPQEMYSPHMSEVQSHERHEMPAREERPIQQSPAELDGREMEQP